MSFNDIDYCLKVREQGLYCVYAPRAELIHFESQSRVASLDLSELDYFHKRWGRLLLIRSITKKTSRSRRRPLRSATMEDFFDARSGRAARQ